MMNKRWKWIFWLGALVCVSLLAACDQMINFSETDSVPAVKITGSTSQDEDVKAIKQALIAAATGREDVLAFLIYDVAIDHVGFSDDRQMALVYLALVDRESGEVIPTEAGIAVAVREETGWRVVLQADAEYAARLNEVPDELLDPQVRAKYMPGKQDIAKGRVFTGYKLPWQAGLAKRVTGSIGHVFTYKSCPATCLYAFDFADGTMFPVHAAKGGTVHMAVWRHPNGNTTRTNFLILEDTTTTPTTYQVYFHLAQNSIPVHLRQKGAVVYQGDFIGNADDTGASTGHHLHFHVHTNPDSHWGTSVDIVFDEVTDNGGRPRTCAEARQFPEFGRQCQPGNFYVSANGDIRRPSGGITVPEADEVITSQEMQISGWGEDDVGVNYIQVQINTGEGWRPAGERMTTTPFTTTIDLCQEGVPDGDFFVALEVIDRVGKTSQEATGMIRLVKNYPCNPPTATPLPTETPAPTATPLPECKPGDTQVAIYAGIDYDGLCKVLEVGAYPEPKAFDPVKNDDIESIKIGSKVSVLLYRGTNYEGERERLLESAPDLNANKVGANQVSSMKVELLPPLPPAPRLMPPVNANNQAPSDWDEILLRWQKMEEAREYRGEVTGAEGFRIGLDWQKETSWEIGKLPAGEYTWTMWARNITGEGQPVSTTFRVAAFEYPPAARLEPLPAKSQSSAILLKWVVDQGEEDVASFEIQYKKGDGEWKTWQQSLAAGQREAWFLAGLGARYAFRIRSEDVRGNWAPYPDKAETAIDVMECRPDEFEALNDNLPDGAAPMDIGAEQVHNLCGLGDEDWIVFTAKQGQALRFHTRPLGGGAAVSIQLHGSGMDSFLGEIVPEDFNQPATLPWTAPEDGFYYLRLRGIHENLAGSDVRYAIGIEAVNRVSPGGVFAFGSLLLPVLWFVYKAFYRVRRKLVS
ncbi:MAG TPA: peptidoglycan DD-metalloendopeptidase family protein [Levilinea sp.]|nr:peptidoglycan DD-metalloendopeptidase family protein [Levilinea sp.]